MNWVSERRTRHPPYVRAAGSNAPFVGLLVSHNFGYVSVMPAKLSGPPALHMQPSPVTGRVHRRKGSHNMLQAFRKRSVGNGGIRYHS